MVKAVKRSANRPDPARLLEAFVASNRCDQAFAALVGSLDGLVYSSALRRTGNAQLAEEVAQNVFAIMARKAGRGNSMRGLRGMGGGIKNRDK